MQKRKEWERKPKYNNNLEKKNMQERLKAHEVILYVKENTYKDCKLEDQAKEEEKKTEGIKRLILNVYK